MTNPTSTMKDYNNISQKYTIMLLLFMFSILIQPTNALHIQYHQPITQNAYDQNTYANQLSSLQSRLTIDINAIKQKFTNINMGLAKTNISSSDQITFLQQNIANQRDALYNIQTYLNVPFALKSCQCVNLTTDQQKSLVDQVSTVSDSIKSLQTLLSKDKNGTVYSNPNCLDGNCPQVQQIKKSIQQLQNYKKIINQTVTSQCCKFINYVYRDNLINNSNWIYGNLTEQQYRLSLFNISNQQNLTQCPSDRPFADTKNNICTNCPPQTPLFNLEKRQCQQRCEFLGLIFSQKLHNCDINRTCETGKFFNKTSKSCQVDLGTDSSCPNRKPIWNNATLICQQCPVNSPYFDRIIRNCRQCTLNQIWQNYTSQCIDKHILPIPCQNGSFFNTKTSLKCQLIPQNSASNSNQSSTNNQQSQTNNNNANVNNPNTFSNCPPSAPFWSSKDFSCHSCREDTPYFNLSSNKCQVCPSQTIFDLASNTCQNKNASSVSVQCKVNEIYNSLLKICQTSTSSRVGICPPETPNWNTVSMSCQRCNSSIPFWNTSTLKCQPCSNYTAWDDASGKCKSTLKKCQIGFQLIISTNTCQPIKCTINEPVFNSSTNKCEKCPEGTSYNNKSLACESSDKNFASVCPQQKPYYNYISLTCDICPQGQTTNSTSEYCTASTGIANHQEYSSIKSQHQQIPNQNHLTYISHLSKTNNIQ